ncbi:MAG: spermidine/putrescine ABC transporter substrate-binding protein [Pseudonocardiales bacterium]
MREMPIEDRVAAQWSLRRGLVTRRTALTGLGLGMAAILTGCTSDGKKRATNSGEDMSATERVVTWSNWPDYIDVGSNGLSHPSLDDFTKRTGITVQYTEDYFDNEEFFTKVTPQLAAGQDTGRDIWCSTDFMVARLIRRGYLQRLDKSVMPNSRALVSSLADVEFDRGRRYSMPWQSGFTGIGYNTKATGGAAVASIDQLFTDPKLKGKVTLLTDMQDTVGLTMLDMGIDPARFTDAEFDKAMARLTQVKATGQLAGFTGNDYTKGLASGQIAACLAYTGDIVQLQADDSPVGYTLPKSGHLLWSDNFVIPNHARHKKNAQRLIDFYYDPRSMARVEEYVNYISPVVGSREALLASDPETAKNALIFPDQQILARAHVFRGMTDEQDTRYNRVFQRLVNS